MRPLVSGGIRSCGICGVLFLCIAASIVAAQQSLPSAASGAVPNLISFSGVLKDASGRAVTHLTGVTFLLYKDDEGGTPLWLETQSVQPDATGHYTVQLGAASRTGLPPELFRSGEGRWLAFQLGLEPEQSRVLLVAVPYAMKASDADTLGGLPPSAFLRATPPVVVAGVPAQSGSTATGTALPSTTSNVTTSGGTANAIPLFTTATNIQNSILTQTGTTVVHVGGKLNLPAVGVATATAGENSRPQNFVASAFNSTTAAAVAQVFQWQAEPAGNNTATPSGTFNLQYGSGTTPPVETGLKISSTGIFSFAQGQTFPGTGKGTVTSVGMSAPATDFSVTGSPLTSAGTLALKWKVAPDSKDTANAIVKRDANGAFSSGAISASATGLTPAITAAGTGVLSVGVSASADESSGLGVFGEGWIGVSGSGSNIGVSGASSSGSGVQGTGGITGVAGSGQTYGVSGGAEGAGQTYGVYGTASSTNGGTATGVYGSGGNGGIGVSGSSSTGTGVVGTSTSGNAMVANGNTEQSRTAGGWVKAMVFINGLTPPYGIVRCFNSTLTGAAATTPPCGFTMKELYIGTFIVDFGFEVDDRFYATSLEGLNTNAYGDPVHLMAYGYSGGTSEDPNTLVVTAIDTNVHLGESTNFAAFVIVF